MRRSDERILTTHAGSLPRPPALTSMLVRRFQNEEVDEAAFAQTVEAAVAGSVAAQREAGIDVANNGEQPRESFFTYVQHRLTGFGGQSSRPVMRDITEFPTFLEIMTAMRDRESVSLLRAPAAIGPVEATGTAGVDDECDQFLRIAGDAGFAELFMTSASPGIVASAMTNQHYPSMTEYVDAVAAGLAPEYHRIVEHGLVLQLDCPDLAMERHTLFADRPLGEFLEFVDVVVAAINRSLAGVPAEAVRLHVCWGNYEGPHHHDVELSARVGALVLSMANPRHAHEWRSVRDQPLPDGMLLVAGVIDTTTNYVEHPEVVFERIERAAEAVGDPHRVLAGTDCGFATSAGFGAVADEVVWEKLKALRAGADLATTRLL
jgi:5-methyltetrahydropteroyltriglutamate--homocysteine methyltransferase